MTLTLDVLFLHAGNKGSMKTTYQDLYRDHATEQAVLGRFMLESVINNGGSVEYIDGQIANLTPTKMAQEVKALKPRLVVVKAASYNPSSESVAIPIAHAYIDALKNEDPSIPVLMVGSIPAALPEYLLQTEPVDFVSSSDGVATLNVLVEVLRAGGDVRDLQKVPSLWFRNNQQIFHTFVGPTVDLNMRVRKTWMLAHMNPKQHRPHNWHIDYKDPTNHPYAVLLTSKNCPFSCNFCPSLIEFRESSTVSKKFRMGFMSPENFVDEVEFLHAMFGVVDFKIKDEMFGIGDHPQRCAQALIDRFGNEARKFNFWAYFRIDTIKPKILDTLEAAGFKWLALGVEAADSNVRSGQDKDFSDDRINNVISEIKNHGIEVGANYIFGLPGDSMSSMQKTYLLACQLNSAFANFYVTKAPPGSQLHRDAMSQWLAAPVDSGIILPEHQGINGWLEYGQYTLEGKPYYIQDDLTVSQIQAMRDWAQVAYFRRNRYRDMIKNNKRFGMDALNNIDAWINEAMLLKRNLFYGKSFWELERSQQELLLPLTVLEQI